MSYLLSYVKMGPQSPGWHPVCLARELLQCIEGLCAPITGQAVLTTAFHSCWVASMPS